MGRLAVIVLAGCTAANYQFQSADLSDLPDLLVTDQQKTPDMAKSIDLAAADLASIDMAQRDFAQPIQDMAQFPPDMVACGGQNQPCCQTPTSTYCNDSSFICHAGSCTDCGVFTQPCCGGDPVTHVNGSCYTGTCLDATHALMGHCE